MAVERTVFWIVVMINVKPQEFARREVIRSTLAAQSENAKAFGVGGTGADLELKLSYFFAVGVPAKNLPADERRALVAGLENETARYDDLAHLTQIEDGALTNNVRQVCRHCLAGDNGKSHHLFAWAHARFYGKAHAIVKQDDDTFVDWSIAAGRWFNGTRTFPPERTVFGYKHHAPLVPGGKACPAGSIYGFSMDIVDFFLQKIKARVYFEDKQACHWVESFENYHNATVNRSGLIGKVENLDKDYLAHGGRMKELGTYAACLTCKGCGGKDNWFFVRHKYAADPCLDTKKYKHKRRPEAMKG